MKCYKTPGATVKECEAFRVAQVHEDSDKIGDVWDTIQDICTGTKPHVVVVRITNNIG